MSDPPPGPGRRYRPIRFATWAVAIAVLVTLPAGILTGTTNFGGRVDPGNLLPQPLLAQSYDWPELHQNPMLTGYTANSTINATNAGTLGVEWDTYLYGSALDSPVIAYDPILHETLAYIGTETGNVLGINIANGQIVWGLWLGSPIRSSPLVYGGSVYIGTFVNPAILRINDTTGAVQARIISPGQLEATPTLATPPGGVPTLYFPTLDSAHSGPLLALNAATLAVEWEFTDYNQTAGSWDSASYAVNANGIPEVLFGTDNPDSSVYAVNALTGARLWWFQCYEPNDGDYDVAAGVTVSPPGVNGFADGVAYAINKISYAYALDLTTGKLIWEVNFDKLAGHSGGVSRSTSALLGTNLVFGYPVGVLDLNAITGKLVWDFKDSTKTESLASPDIVGPSGNGIGVTGDVGGYVDVVSLATGAKLYSYQTGGYIAGSPAVSGDNIVFASSNGFLYDFALGGGNEVVLPTTRISSPVDGVTFANPNGDMMVTGSATDPIAVAEVEVAVQSDSPVGPWWDAATSSWSPGPINNLATLSMPGSTSSPWSFDFPVPSSGGSYEVYANAVSALGPSDLVGAEVNFAVTYATNGPHFEASATYVAPGGTLTLNGGGFGKSVAVHVTLDDRLLTTITSSSTGQLPPTTVTIPSNASFGLSTLVATNLEGQNSTFAITIANSWDQLGYGPGRIASEPNDLVYNYLIFPGGNNWEKLAWHFEPGSGAAFNSSPVVVNGVAYVGDSLGQLFALDIHNGGLIWTYTLASGAAIDGTPAVDTQLGLVFFGASDGTLDAVHVSTGNLAWSDSIGGNVRAPAFSGGEIYVTSSSGAVEAIVESTGAVTWTHPLSAIGGAAAVDLTGNFLAVGEAGGDVLGLNAATGATLWTYATGGSISSTPVVSTGRVFVGSSNDRVSALSETTGKLDWSFTTSGAVEDSGSISGNRSGGVTALFIGSEGGYLYGLNAATGRLDLNVKVGSPVMGVSTANGIAVIETAKGGISATRTWVSQLDWTYSTAATLTTTPVLEDGSIYVSGTDGNVYAFSTEGQPPV